MCGIGNSGEEGGGGGSKSQNFKAMHEAKLEFPDGWGGGGGGHRANPFRGRYGYFLQPLNVTRVLINHTRCTLNDKWNSSLDNVK